MKRANPLARGRRRGDLAFYFWIIAHIALAFLLVASVGTLDRPPRDRRDGPTSAESADAPSLAVGAATTRGYRRRALASNATDPHQTPPPPPPPPPAANASSPARAELVDSGGTTSRSRETSGSDRAAVGGDESSGVEGENGATDEGAYYGETDEGARAHARDDDDRSVGYGAREYVPFAIGVATLSFVVLMCFDTLVALTLLLCLGAVVAACAMVLNNSEDDTRWRDDEFNGPM